VRAAITPGAMAALAAQRAVALGTTAIAAAPVVMEDLRSTPAGVGAAPPDHMAPALMASMQARRRAEPVTPVTVAPAASGAQLAPAPPAWRYFLHTRKVEAAEAAVAISPTAELGALEACSVAAVAGPEAMTTVVMGDPAAQALLAGSLSFTGASRRR